MPETEEQIWAKKYMELERLSQGWKKSESRLQLAIMVLKNWLGDSVSGSVVINRSAIAELVSRLEKK